MTINKPIEIARTIADALYQEGRINDQYTATELFDVLCDGLGKCSEETIGRLYSGIVEHAVQRDSDLSDWASGWGEYYAQFDDESERQ